MMPVRSNLLSLMFVAIITSTCSVYGANDAKMPAKSKVELMEAYQSAKVQSDEKLLHAVSKEIHDYCYLTVGKQPYAGPVWAPLLWTVVLRS